MLLVDGQLIPLLVDVDGGSDARDDDRNWAIHVASIELYGDNGARLLVVGDKQNADNVAERLRTLFRFEIDGCTSRHLATDGPSDNFPESYYVDLKFGGDVVLNNDIVREVRLRLERS